MGNLLFFFWNLVYLEGLVKTIICVPWAVFPCRPARERSVFDMPVVLEKDGRRASVPFPYRSAECSMGSDRPT